MSEGTSNDPATFGSAGISAGAGPPKPGGQLGGAVVGHDLSLPGDVLAQPGPEGEARRDRRRRGGLPAGERPGQAVGEEGGDGAVVLAAHADEEHVLRVRRGGRSLVPEFADRSLAGAVAGEDGGHPGGDELPQRLVRGGEAHRQPGDVPAHRRRGRRRERFGHGRAAAREQ
ncbi:hypothetical protein CXF31_04440, partial [Corynebacterium bovis]